MKSINSGVFIVSALLLIAGCNNVEGGGEIESLAVKITDNSKDSIALTKLVRQVYQWHEKVNPMDFDVKTNTPSDTLYAGVNWEAHNKQVRTIEESKYFDQQFIDGYQKIARHIDSELKTGKITWLVGDLPPFGNDANPWCNCQDNPENFWNILKITGLKIVKDHASFSWTWGDGFMYKVKAARHNGTWKISYLEGFDYDNYK